MSPLFLSLVAVGNIYQWQYLQVVTHVQYRITFSLFSSIGLCLQEALHSHKHGHFPLLLPNKKDHARAGESLTLLSMTVLGELWESSTTILQEKNAWCTWGGAYKIVGMLPLKIGPLAEF